MAEVTYYVALPFLQDDDGRMGPRSNNDQKNTTREELLCARSLLQHVLLRFR